MTHISFIKQIIKYYGDYERRGIQEYVWDYIQEFSERDLDVLFNRLLLEYSGQFRYVPDIEILERKKREINVEEDNKVNGQLIGDRKKKTFAPPLIEERPNKEQREAAQQMLHGLAEKMTAGEPPRGQPQTLDKSIPKTGGEPK